MLRRQKEVISHRETRASQTKRKQESFVPVLPGSTKEYLSPPIFETLMDGDQADAASEGRQIKFEVNLTNDTRKIINRPVQFHPWIFVGRRMNFPSSGSAETSLGEAGSEE